MRTRRALPGGPVLGMLLLTLLPQGAANGQAVRQPSGPVADLGEFWPLNAPPRKWNLIAQSGRHSRNAKIQMTVENQTIGPGEFVLWFSHKPGQAPGKRAGERYRLCKTAAMTWLFFDAYINAFPPTIHHDVVSDRILYSPSDGPQLDLIGNGLYQACGGVGQPYLLWSHIPPQYRIQVWGHLTENSKYRWYWDAVVTKPEQMVNDCLNPPKQLSAVRVREAWWDTFKNPSGAWQLGGGGTDPGNGAPSGSGVTYGRTVWHGAGQLPYLMTAGGKAAPGTGWCVNEIGVPPAK